MNPLCENAENLSREIRNSAAYKEYLSAREAVKDCPELLMRLTDYRRFTRELARAEDEGAADLLPYRQRVSDAYYSAVSHEGLRRYLEAEREVVAVVCDVMEIIAGGCDFENLL